MQKPIDFLFRCLIFLFVAVPVFALAQTSRAQQIAVDAGLVCNHPEELERYIALYHEGDSAEAVVDKINHETGQSACGMMTVAYVHGEDIKTISIGDGFGAIVKIEIVGIFTGTEWLRTQPTQQFMILSVQDRRA